MFHRQPPAMVVVINFAGVPGLLRRSMDVITNHARLGAGIALLDNRLDLSPLFRQCPSSRGFSVALGEGGSWCAGD
jgi:hypothetical protein